MLLWVAWAGCSALGLLYGIAWLPGSLATGYLMGSSKDQTGYGIVTYRVTITITISTIALNYRVIIGHMLPQHIH
jgi:hypothetical protein